MTATRNLVSTSSSACSSGDQLVGDPQLGTLANNGGLTRTLRPAYGSPVVD